MLQDMHPIKTHLRRVDSSTTTLWTGLFPTAGCLVSFYYICFIVILVINANSAEARRLIYVCIVCQLPLLGFPD